MSRFVDELKTRLCHVAGFRFDQVSLFGDLLFPPYPSVDEILATAEPALIVASDMRWVVVQLIGKEIRYYAGPLPEARADTVGVAGDAESGRDEIGIVASVDAAVAFILAYLAGEALESLPVTRERKYGTAVRPSQQTESVQPLTPFPERFSDPLFPMIVLGYAVRSGVIVDETAFEDELTPSLSGIESHLPAYGLVHQYGGYLCDHIHIAGLILTLEINRGKLFSAGDSLIDDLRASGESRDGSIRSDLVTRWNKTHGEKMDGIALGSWQQLLAGLTPIPTLTWGAEGILVSDAADAIDYVRGWDLARVVRHDDRPASIVSAAVIDEAALHCLRRIGTALAIDGPPSLIFLWENSD